MQFPECVESARCDVAEVDGGGAETTDIADFGEDGLEVWEVVFSEVGSHTGEAGAEYGLVELSAVGDADGFAVALGAVVFLGAEEFVEYGGVNGGEVGGVVAVQGDGDRVEWLVMDEGGGSVDGVDDPAVFLAGSSAELFAEYGVGGVALGDGVAEIGFDGAVGFGDEVFGRCGLGSDVEFGEAGAILEGYLTGLASDVLDEVLHDLLFM